MKKFWRQNLVSTLIIGLLPTILLASSGTIQTPNQYAWGENTGFVNFAPDNGNIVITDTQLTGYAWDPVFGWLNLSPDGSGVKNDGQGNLSGTAWSAGAGFVDFAGVKINSSGKFTGMASGQLYGRINFDCSTCNVTTTWRPASESSNTPRENSSGSIVSQIITKLFNTENDPQPVPAAEKKQIDAQKVQKERTTKVKAGINAKKESKIKLVSKKDTNATSTINKKTKSSFGSLVKSGINRTVQIIKTTIKNILKFLYRLI